LNTPNPPSRYATVIQNVSLLSDETYTGKNSTSSYPNICVITQKHSKLHSFFFLWPNKTFYLSIYTNKYLKMKQHCNSSCHVNVPARAGMVPFFQGINRKKWKGFVFLYLCDRLTRFNSKNIMVIERIKTINRGTTRMGASNFKF